MNRITVSIDDANESLLSQFDEVNMFNQRHLYELMGTNEDFKRVSPFIPYKKADNQWYGTGWKKSYMITELENFFKRYEIYLYCGYNASILAYRNISFMDKSKHYVFMIYTNTNLVIEVDVKDEVDSEKLPNINNAVSHDIIKFRCLVNNEEVFQIYNADKKHVLFIAINETLYNITNERMLEIDKIIREKIIWSVHPYVYADYLLLCSPEYANRLLMTGKFNLDFDIRNRELEEEINLLKNRIIYLTHENERLISEQEEFTNDYVNLDSQYNDLRSKYETLSIYNFQMKKNSSFENEVLTKKNKELYEENQELLTSFTRIKKNNSQPKVGATIIGKDSRGFVKYDDDDDSDDEEEPTIHSMIFNKNAYIFMALSVLYVAGVIYTVNKM